MAFVGVFAVVVVVIEAGVVEDLGCNSIDILNFGYKTGPIFGPNSVLGHRKFRHVSKFQK